MIECSFRSLAGVFVRVILRGLDREQVAVLIIYALSEGTKRHNRLQREVPGISQKMLTKTLRSLERDGLPRRKVYPVVLPKVEYSLTPLGESLISILAELCKWAEEHIDEDEAVRRDYDSRSGQK